MCFLETESRPPSQLTMRTTSSTSAHVKVGVPYRVTTWLWCDLPFIEYLVVELDYEKMSATDLSSFDIAL